jgi:hypothetical protein
MSNISNYILKNYETFTNNNNSPQTTKNKQFRINRLQNIFNYKDGQALGDHGPKYILNSIPTNEKTLRVNMKACIERIEEILEKEGEHFTTKLIKDPFITMGPTFFLLPFITKNSNLTFSKNFLDEYNGDKQHSYLNDLLHKFKFTQTITDKETDFHDKLGIPIVSFNNDPTFNKDLFTKIMNKKIEDIPQYYLRIDTFMKKIAPLELFLNKISRKDTYDTVDYDRIRIFHMMILVFYQITTLLFITCNIDLIPKIINLINTGNKFHDYVNKERVRAMYGENSTIPYNQRKNIPFSAFELKNSLSQIGNHAFDLDEQMLKNNNILDKIRITNGLYLKDNVWHYHIQGDKHFSMEDIIYNRDSIYWNNEKKTPKDNAVNNVTGYIRKNLAISYLNELTNYFEGKNLKVLENINQIEQFGEKKIPVTPTPDVVTKIPNLMDDIVLDDYIGNNIILSEDDEKILFYTSKKLIIYLIMEKLGIKDGEGKWNNYGHNIDAQEYRYQKDTFSGKCLSSKEFSDFFIDFINLLKVFDLTNIKCILKNIITLYYTKITEVINKKPPPYDYAASAAYMFSNNDKDLIHNLQEGVDKFMKTILTGGIINNLNSKFGSLVERNSPIGNFPVFLRNFVEGVAISDALLKSNIHNLQKIYSIIFEFFISVVATTTLNIFTHKNMNDIKTIKNKIALIIIDDEFYKKKCEEIFSVNELSTIKSKCEADIIDCNANTEKIKNIKNISKSQYEQCKTNIKEITDQIEIINNDSRNDYPAIRKKNKNKIDNCNTSLNSDKKQYKTNMNNKKIIIGVLGLITVILIIMFFMKKK